ncbi:MAG: LysR family transcriptional regulator [Chthoniobacteraceae bacterium]
MLSDLNLLRAFVAIVESGSISAAARNLRLGQPTLSRQLQALEEQCGAALLRRDTHRMSLTGTGHRFLEDARALLSLADESEQRLRHNQTAVQGNLRIFSTIDFGQSVVSRLIASFIQAHPAVTVDLAYSNRPLHMIEEGCDAGIIAGTLADESVIARPLGHIRRYPVASPAYLRGREKVSAPEEIRAWAWLALSSSQFGGSKEVTLYANGQERSFPIQPVMISEGVTSLREAARMGLGIAILPDWLIEEDLVAARLVRVLPQWWAQDLPAHLVYPVQCRLPQRVRTFIHFAADYMKTVLKPDEPDGKQSEET